MDMYWAYILNTNLKKFKKDSNDEKKLEKEEHINVKVNNNCGVCGQNPYCCMCKENSKLIRKTDTTAYT